jgi:hypothetical protein
MDTLATARLPIDWHRTLLISGLQIFLVVVGLLSIRRFSVLFGQRHGWRHRLCGGLNFAWLVAGCCTIGQQCSSRRFALCYDIALACFGIAATLTAARDFPHRYVSNPDGQSGTLSRQAIVTQSEMVEHSFYQGLNLCQALYLHYSAKSQQTESAGAEALLFRWIALLAVTAPWWMRRQFPVHSFSDNWKKVDHAKKEEIALYKVKKAQYMFGKHVILHGLNLTVCCHGNGATFVSDLISSASWRIFWICLNTAYVMEFFLQSLVKRGVIEQPTMLLLNLTLMVISSIAALDSVLGHVRWDLCVVSCFLNMIHRGHDVLNTMAIAATVINTHRQYSKQLTSF